MDETLSSGLKIKRLAFLIFLIFVSLAVLNLYICFVKCHKKLVCWHADDADQHHDGLHQHIIMLPEGGEKVILRGQLGYDPNIQDHLRTTEIKRPSSLANSKYDFVSSINGMQRKLPQVLIIGVKKGGTRALLQFLRLHPDVRASGREAHFFDRNYDRGLEWYRSKMPLSVDGQLTMEKTPSYFITDGTASRVYNMSRNQRLLIVVRDPVTRAISDYAQTISKKRKRKRKTFDDLVFLNQSTGLVDNYWSAIKIGIYVKYLEKWLKYFPLQQMHFVSGEELVRDPAAELAKVQNFLNLRLLITRDHFYFNETKGFPCLKKSEGSGKPHCLGETKGRAHPMVKPSTIHRLRQFYRPFNLKFYKMVGIDFGWA